jgi:hypothetical protein
VHIRRKLAAVVTAAGLLCTLTLTSSIALGAGGNPAADLDQCANDPAPSFPTDGCNANASQWVNGNLGASKSIYREGDSIPYRMRFSNLPTTGAGARDRLHHDVGSNGRRVKSVSRCVRFVLHRPESWCERWRDPKGSASRSRHAERHWCRRRSGGR